MTNLNLEITTANLKSNGVEVKIISGYIEYKHWNCEPHLVLWVKSTESNEIFDVTPNMLENIK